MKNKNRIQKHFQNKPTGTLSIYFTAGYPTLEDTLPVIETLVAHGVDMIEIGIPFSDPMADGEVIQQSSQRAIENGISLSLIFKQLKNVRDKVDIPLIMMGYLNPIMKYGIENFCRDCADTGIDGVIIPDLPFADYLQDYKPVAERYGLRIIMLITPETSPERVKMIDDNTDGFIYMVSTAATTGTQQTFPAKTLEYFDRINQMNLRNPRLIGFGISNKSTFDAAQKAANGVIVGSGFINALDREKSLEKAVASLLQQLKS